MTDDNPTSKSLTPASRAEAMLRDASTVQEVAEVIDLAEAARVLARKARLGLDNQNQAALIKLKAERKAGQMLVELTSQGILNGRGGSNYQRGSLKLSDLGVTHNQSKRWRDIAGLYSDEELERRAADATGEQREFTQAELLKEVVRIQRQQREHTPAMPDAGLPDSVDGKVSLLHGDFRERLVELEPRSVDLIITDPPYPKDDLHLYSDLAQVAARLLGPRGICFVWTGQLFLPEVIKRLSEHLNYGWTYSLQLPGSGSRIMGRHIIQAWKPVLAFTTGTWPSGEWGDDVLISPSREKTSYEWQQTGAPAQRLIERYSAPDGLICDPFLGVGSFGLAARDAGRRFVGVELDAGRFAQAKERIA